MVLNSAYIGIFENFVRAPGAKHLAQWDIHLLCTDTATPKLVQALGWKCRSVQRSGRQAAQVYTKRIPYVLQLVRAGRDVLITDLDAIWLGDPMPELLALSAKAGIVSSRGGSPPRANQRWGATFCMGFIFFKGTDARVRDALGALTVPMREDQSDFNHNLLREGLEFDARKIDYVTSTDVSFGTINARNKSYTGLRVAMLPHTRFMRVCPPTSDFSDGAVTIAHCHNRGKQQWLKVNKLGSLKLWFLPKKPDGLGPPPEDAHPVFRMPLAVRAALDAPKAQPKRKPALRSFGAPLASSLPVLLSADRQSADPRCAFARDEPGEALAPGTLELSLAHGVLCAVGRGSGRGPQLSAALSAVMLQLAVDQVARDGTQLRPFRKLRFAIEGVSCGRADLAYTSGRQEGCSERLVPHFSLLAAPSPSSPSALAPFAQLAALSVLAGDRAAGRQACAWQPDASTSASLAGGFAARALERPLLLLVAAGPCEPASGSSRNGSSGGGVPCPEPQTAAAASAESWACAVSLPDSGVSVRLPLLLFSGRPTLLLASPTREWYRDERSSGSLAPWVHFVPLEAGARDAAERAEATLGSNRTAAAQLGVRARAFAEAHLSLRVAVRHFAFQLLAATGTPSRSLPSLEGMLARAAGEKNKRTDDYLQTVARADLPALAMWWPHIFHGHAAPDR